jgi:hypothetical protein
MTKPPAIPTAEVTGEDDMPAEIDFSGGTRGMFHRSEVQLSLPVYLDAEVQSYLGRIASQKGTTVSALANEMLKQDIAILEIMK